MGTDLASGLTERFKHTIFKRITPLPPSKKKQSGGKERRREPCKALLLKMLQPDEGTAALQRTRWGAAKASGVNRPALLCAVLEGSWIAQPPDALSPSR